MNDYHIHTYRCGHAQGDVEDYVRFAVAHDFSVLGFSDHTPLPDNFCSEIRMKMSDLAGYRQSIRKTRKKYPQIKILGGLECEYTRDYYNFYKDVLLEEMGFDYLSLGQHFFPCDGAWVYFWKEMRGFKELMAYTDNLVEGMKSGLFSMVVHPDAFGHFYELWDENTQACSRYILEAAQDTGIPLEINGGGFRKEKLSTSQGLRRLYPLEPFWELAAQYNIKVIINSDAHMPQELLASYEECLALASRYELNLIDYLPSLNNQNSNKL